MSNADDLLFEKLEAFAREHQNEHRFRHTQGVVKAAEQFAVRYGADPKKAMTAAWFHDNYKDAGPLMHGPVAAEKIRELFGIEDEDIINAIKYHTTSRPGMSVLEKVVKMADLLEENRSYPDVEKLRAAMTDDIDESMLILLREEQKILIGRGTPYDPLTDLAVEWFEKIHERKLNGQ